MYQTAYSVYRGYIPVTVMGARRGGARGDTCPPWKFKNMGAPHKDNLTRKNLKIFFF